MSNERFTQGEWRVVPTGAHWNNPELQNLQICYSDVGECVCDTVYEKADAHLISAAPDMYRALREVVLGAEEYCERTGKEISWLAQARLALAKADGE